MGNVIGVVGHEDQVIALAHVEAFDDPLIKRIPPLRILQARFPQPHQGAVFVAVHHLPVGEYEINKVLSEAAGKRLLQQAQKLFRFLLRHHAEGFVEIGHDLLLRVDVAAVDAADRGLVRLEAPAQFADFFLIHTVKYLLPLELPGPASGADAVDYSMSPRVCHGGGENEKNRGFSLTNAAFANMIIVYFLIR